MAAWNDCLLSLNSWGILSRGLWLCWTISFFLPLKVFEVDDDDVDDDVVVDEIVDVAVAFENDEDVVSLVCCCCCWLGIDDEGNWAIS